MSAERVPVDCFFVGVALGELVAISVLHLGTSAAVGWSAGSVWGGTGASGHAENHVALMFARGRAFMSWSMVMTGSSSAVP